MKGVLGRKKRLFRGLGAPDDAKMGKKGGRHGRNLHLSTRKKKKRGTPKGRNKSPAQEGNFRSTLRMVRHRAGGGAMFGEAGTERGAAPSKTCRTGGGREESVYFSLIEGRY